MLVQRALAFNAFILCMSLLIASAVTRRMPSTPASLATIKAPCDLKGRAKLAKSGVKGGKVLKCSSAEECLALGKQYLAKPSGAEMAQEPLERAIALGPGNAEAYKQLASAHMRRYEDTNIGHMSQEEYCLTETLCRVAISLVPDDHESYLLLGQILNEEKYYGFRSDDAAVEALKRAIELKPAWPDAYCELAHAHYLLNQYEESAAAYTMESALRRGNETQLGQINSVILEYQKHHEVRDAFVVAEIYTKLGRYNEALTSLQHAESINPDDDVIHFWIGKTFLSLGDIESAKREQKLLVELCRSKDKFFVTQCEGSAKGLLEAIEQKSR